MEWDYDNCIEQNRDWLYNVNVDSSSQEWGNASSAPVKILETMTKNCWHSDI